MYKVVVDYNPTQQHDRFHPCKNKLPFPLLYEQATVNAFLQK